MTKLARLDYLMLTLLVLLIVLLVKSIITQPPPQPSPSYKIIVIDGCEYIQFPYMQHPVLHKGNCTNHLQSVKLEK